MEHSFNIGDKVRSTRYNRRDGSIVRIVCKQKECSACNTKKWDECKSETKNFIFVKFDKETKNKIYHYTEVELENQKEPTIGITTIHAREGRVPETPKKLVILLEMVSDLPLIEEIEEEEERQEEKSEAEEDQNVDMLGWEYGPQGMRNFI